MQNKFDDRKSLVQYFREEKQKGEKDLNITGLLQNILNNIDRKEEEKQERIQKNIPPRC